MFNDDNIEIYSQINISSKDHEETSLVCILSLKKELSHHLTVGFTRSYLLTPDIQIIPKLNNGKRISLTKHGLADDLKQC